MIFEIALRNGWGLAMRMRVAILAAMMLVIDATKIRLERIDAPETDQVCLNAKAIRWNCGIEARDQLAAHLAGQEIKCTSSGVDANRGTLAKCYLAGEDLNGWMVQQGWALPYFRHSFIYADAEKDARTRNSADCGRAHSLRRRRGVIATIKRPSWVR